MPILETSIFGTKIEINYEKEEKAKLEILINNLQDRIFEFSHLKGKVSDTKILFLSALKAEDVIYDLNKNFNENKKNEISKISTLEDLDKKIKEIILLKDEIINLNKKNGELSRINNLALEEVEKINTRLSLIIKTIINKNNDNT